MMLALLRNLEADATYVVVGRLALGVRARFGSELIGSELSSRGGVVT